MRVAINKTNFDRAVILKYPRLTQKEFCDKFNINYAYLSKLKSKPKPNQKPFNSGPKFIDKLLTAFGGEYTFNELFQIYK